jgi:hypothetical protein
MKFAIPVAFVLGVALQALAQVGDAAKAAELLVDLKRAPTQVARLNILSNNKDVSDQRWRYFLTSCSDITRDRDLVVVRL